MSKNSVFIKTLNSELPRPYDPSVDFILPQHGLMNYPPRKYVEIRIPLPPREAEISDVPFGATDVRPQYAVSYMDKTYYDEYVRDGKIAKYLADQQKRWYEKLGIKTSHEKAVDREIGNLRQLKDSLPTDSLYANATITISPQRQIKGNK